MRILFLGGTQFVGRHMVSAALEKGHEVSLFNRGRTNADLFPEAKKIIGDRDGGLEPLRGKTWDAVVDVNGYVPRLVRDAAELLKGSTGRYVFISTGSVYDMANLPPNADESAPLEVLEDETTEEWNGPAYGGLKVLCERVVQEIYPENHLIPRLGVVAGPYDHTDRVTYWVNRTARGGDMLVPATPGRHIQFVDARDLAEFVLSGIKNGLLGIYNTDGRSGTWEEFLTACQKAAGLRTNLVWVDDFDFLQKNVPEVPGNFGAYPMAVPPELDQVFTINCEKARKNGMVFRPFEDSARDILAWDKTRPAEEKRQAGISLEQENQLLQKWKSRRV